MKEQEINISDKQLYQLIAHGFIKISKDKDSIILIIVEKKIDKDTFPEDRLIHKLKKFFICKLIGHNEMGVYSTLVYCQRCFHTYDPSDLCSQCKTKYSSEDDE